MYAKTTKKVIIEKGNKNKNTKNNSYRKYRLINNIIFNFLTEIINCIYIENYNIG